jgi:nucleotide-binding universal stress UspA family protein
MSPEDKMQDIHRILVALDASPASLAALDLAADLAERYQAELLGIYVEDINLLRSAEMPFAREFRQYSGTSQDLDSRQIERELQAQACRVENLLAAIARKANLRWSFLKSRGVIHGKLLEAAQGTDLIILGKTGWSGSRQIGSTARNVAVQSKIQSMILLRKVRRGTPIMVAYDGSVSSQKALIAAQLISSKDIPLIVLLITDDPQQAKVLENEVKARTDQLDVPVEFRHARDFKGDRLSQMAMINGCDVVVMPVESRTFDAESLVEMLNEADCAVLLVR